MNNTNVVIAMVLTIILAVIVEGFKYIRIKLAENKNDKRKIISMLSLMDYVRNKVDDKLIVSYTFADLVFNSYLMYITKMTSTITKTHIHYDIEDGDDSMFFIDGLTSDKSRIVIRKLIRDEILKMLKLDEFYTSLYEIESDVLDNHIDFALDFIEKDLDFQMIASDTVIQMLK